ncbi:DUF456 family protein [bacterium]|nr:DUF456 family protein [bacterium]
MDWQQILGLSITWLVMLVGVLGCVLPAVPGAPLVFVAALVHRLIFGESASASTWMLVVIFLLMLFSLLLDYLASMYGAKRLGSSVYGIVGAVVGGTIGLIIFNIPGALLGPFVGAFLGEIISGKDWKGSGKAGLGATLGLLGGAVGKLACAMAMAGLFTVNVVWKLIATAN